MDALSTLAPIVIGMIFGGLLLRSLIIAIWPNSGVGRSLDNTGSAAGGFFGDSDGCDGGGDGGD